MYIDALRKKRGTEKTKDCNVSVMLNWLEGQHGCNSEIPEIFTFNPKSWILAFHRITEQLRLERGWGGHLAHTPCSWRVLEQGKPEPSSDSFWIPPKDRDTKTSLGTCAGTPSSSQCFLMFKGNLLCFSLWPLTLGCIWKEPDCCLCALPSLIRCS